jgi:hypothetical protein
MSDLSPQAQSLIELALEHDGPSREDRRRIERLLVSALGSGAALATSGAAAAAGGVTGSGKAAGTALLGSAVASKTWISGVALGLGLGGAAGIGVATAAHFAFDAPAYAPAAKTARAIEARLAPPAPTRAARATIPEPEAADDPAPEPTTLAPPTGPVRSTVTRSAAREGETNPRSLADEMRLLESAQRALREQRPAEALALLDQHAATFPNGALRDERTAARVFALCALHQQSEAQRAAEAFIADAPTSPLIPRVRESCAFTATSSSATKRFE